MQALLVGSYPYYLQDKGMQGERKQEEGVWREGVLRLEKHESEAWIMQARQKMKTRCGLLLSASDGALFLVYLHVLRRKGGYIHAGVVSWFLRSLTATLLLAYYHVSMVQGKSFQYMCFVREDFIPSA